ncbi:MAG: hypothetical protein HY000_08965 [Planctomycetes bacterium]|nr:hypothetical protein [Planctomycetota bacterium]
MPGRSKKSLRCVAGLAMLVLCHPPCPCYDGDGEDRGMLTGGVLDPAAWHIVFLGVAPEKDIDRGPLSSESNTQNLGGSAFDAPCVVSAKVLQFDSPTSAGPAPDQAPASAPRSCPAVPTSIPGSIPATFGSSFSARAPQAWRQQLCLILV